MSVKHLVAAAALAFYATPALAGELCEDVASRKTIEEAKEAAMKAGYTDITGMGEDDGCYEAKGLSADGSKFEVYIHPATLEIVKVKKED